jgi:aspartyl aminopeptidase
MNECTDDLLDFIWASPSPWHAVAEMERRLGYAILDEKGLWADGLKGSAGSEFAPVVIKRGGSLMAVKFPKAELDLTQLKFRMVAAHTDSPCLKLKPRAPQEYLGNCRQWGVEIYGGVLLNSWLDRDLGVAGQCHWYENGEAKQALVRFDDWGWRVPQLAIHLDREANKGLTLNPQKHMIPVVGLDDGELWMEKALSSLGLAEKPDSFQFDLVLYDTQKPSYGGMNGEFIYAPRMDNLAMCHAGLQALESADVSDNTISVLCCFDHEEVGSTSTEGAASSFLPSVLERLCLSLGCSREEYLAGLSRSFMISADMAHALHPNYPDRHEPDHQPLLGEGPVLKGNANMRYAGGGASHARFLNWASEVSVSVQDFVCRTDMGCGSTIGPTVASLLGIEAVDVGNPMLSMHSCREMSAMKDHEQMIKVMTRCLSSS